MKSRALGAGLIGLVLLLVVALWRAPRTETAQPGTAGSVGAAARPDSGAPGVSERSPGRPAAEPRIGDAESGLPQFERTLSALFEPSDRHTQRASPEAIDQFLRTHNHSAASLLAAFSDSRDTNLLRLAAERWPQDPQVQLRVLSTKLFPEQERDWIGALKASSPDNALAYYLAAAYHLRSGDPDQAWRELQAGNLQKKLTDYTPEAMQNLEELYRLAGDSEVMAKARAYADLNLWYLGELKRMTRGMFEQHDALQQAGQAEAATQLALMGIEIAQHLSLGEGQRGMFSHSVGTSFERDFLRRLDPNQSYPQLSLPVADMLQAIESQREALRQAGDSFQRALQSNDEELLRRLFDRIKVIGEYQACVWLMQQQGAP